MTKTQYEAKSWPKQCLSLVWVSAQAIADKVNEINARDDAEVIATQVHNMPGATAQTDKDSRVWACFIWFNERPQTKVKLPNLAGKMSDADMKASVERIMFAANKTGELPLPGHVPA